ncbi:Fc receptor-like protein 6 isoform X2 [Cavia porcellus]|uniref:Fc receptor-like protein 6 isoform X2 n=1 Tax=Cavia porcellus TaxID=10141 RepID=UPI002FDFE6FB
MLRWMALLLLVSCVGRCAPLNLQELNLQVQPNPVFEGDPMTLQCEERGSKTVSQVKFYKDKNFFAFFVTNQPLSVGAATMESNGQYHCTKDVPFQTYTFIKTSAVTKVGVQETSAEQWKMCWASPVHIPFPSEEQMTTNAYLALTSRTLKVLGREQGTLSELMGWGMTLSPIWVTELYPGLCWSSVFSFPDLTDQGSPPWSTNLSPELFRPPVLSTDPSPEPREGSLVSLRCQTALHPKKPNLKLLFSFYKDGHMQNTSRHAEFHIPEVRKEDSGVYWCKVALEGGQVEKQSPSLEIRVQVKSEQDAGNYSCEANNSVSREKSEPKQRSLDGLQDLSTPTRSYWLIAGPLGTLLGLMLIVVVLLAYFTPWRRAEPPPALNPPSAPAGEQCPLDGNVHQQEDKEEDITYSVVQRGSKRNKGHLCCLHGSETPTAQYDSLQGLESKKRDLPRSSW